VLDSGPLGLATNPKESTDSLECTLWLQGLSDAGVDILVPEIVDFEVRRELMRAGKVAGIARLDHFLADVEGRYLAINTDAMRLAARFWADARNAGLPTAPDLALDADVILAGQAAALNNSDVTIATTNVAHLARFVSADHWRNIQR
jgi:hypothetical protein